MAHKLGADVVVSDGQELTEAGGADIILATSNSYKAAADTLRGLRPDGRLMFIGGSENQNIDVIVIGSRGRSGLKKMLLGSVASKVITYASCPVLVIK